MLALVYVDFGSSYVREREVERDFAAALEVGPRWPFGTYIIVQREFVEL